MIEIDRSTGADPGASTWEKTPAIMPWLHPLAYTHGEPQRIESDFIYHTTENWPTCRGYCLPWPNSSSSSFKHPFTFIGFYDFATNSRKVFL